MLGISRWSLAKESFPTHDSQMSSTFFSKCYLKGKESIVLGEGALMSQDPKVLIFLLVRVRHKNESPDSGRKNCTWPPTLTATTTQHINSFNTGDSSGQCGILRHSEASACGSATVS